MKPIAYHKGNPGLFDLLEKYSTVEKSLAQLIALEQDARTKLSAIENHDYMQRAIFEGALLGTLVQFRKLHPEMNDLEKAIDKAIADHDLDKCRGLLVWHVRMHNVIAAIQLFEKTEGAMQQVEDFILEYKKADSRFYPDAFMLVHQYQAAICGWKS